MIGLRDRDIQEGQNDGVVEYKEPDNEVGAIFKSMDFQQPQMGMGGQQLDDQHYQWQHFGGINYDRDFQQQPPPPCIQGQYSGYGAHPQADFVDREWRFSPYGNSGGIGNRYNSGVSLAQVLSRTQAEARRDPFMLGGFRQAGTGENPFGIQRRQPVPHLSQNY